MNNLMMFLLLHFMYQIDFCHSSDEIDLCGQSFLFFICCYRIKLLTPYSLAVYDVGRRDKGMYQCLVTNKESSAQAVAELKLGGKYFNKPLFSVLYIHHNTSLL